MPASNAAHCIEDRGDVLLLGMVFAHRALEPKRGQEFRDRVRCEAVKSLGYNVFSLDDKHPDTDINEHCRANFADKRRMLKAMHSKWEAMPAFKHIVLDYFFSPIGWARSRWSAPFFSQTLPALAEQGIVSSNGKIWLPNLSCITECLIDAEDELSQYYRIRLVSVKEIQGNPLYRATELVETPLLSCPDALTNETQIRPLLNHSAFPFYVLERIADGEKGGFEVMLEAPPTPKRQGKRSRPEDSLSSVVSPKKRTISRLRLADL